MWKCRVPLIAPAIIFSFDFSGYNLFFEEIGFVRLYILFIFYYGFFYYWDLLLR